MKKEIADKWIAALRSGEYRQTAGRLRKGGAFCCLGVLCNLHAQAHPNIAAGQRDPGRYDDLEGVLSKRVMAWAGMASNDGEYVEGSVIETLANQNDLGRRFRTIANIIEKRWRDL